MAKGSRGVDATWFGRETQQSDRRWTMAAVVMETESRNERRPYFSAIRWTAILGGLVGGMGSYMLLALLGVATGLTAVDPQAAQPAAGVSMGMGIWTGLITLISAFIGGYLAARMSGLSRSSDGMLHGFVNWGATMVLFAFLATSAASMILGGTFAMLGQGLQGVGTAAGQAAEGQQGGLTNQFERIITGSEGGSISAEDMGAVQERLQAGDRQGAVDYMVNQMGFTQERADQVAGMAAPLFGGELGQEARQAAATTVDALAAASWWLFIALTLSLVAALVGGRMGIKAQASRTVGDHYRERRQHREVRRTGPARE
jgi:hypothetical protein